MVGLVLDIEEFYQISFPAEELNFGTFATPLSVWTAIQKLTESSTI
jgi:acyl carrier protein